ncbi:hypothetical protein LguiA_030403 [Lonicera macranthoides]
MSVYASKIFSLFLLLLCYLSYTKCEEYISFFSKKEIHIVNGLPDNTYSLVFRCQSKDDDLGEHQLLVGQEYYWKFRVNFFKTTLFFCHFYWGDQDNVFDVFRASTPFPDCSPAADDTPRCYWLVKDDGFYYSNEMRNYASYIITGKKNTSKNNGIRVIALRKYRKKMYITCDLKKNKVLVAFYHPLCIKREATTWPAPVHGCRWLSIILTTPEIDLRSTRSTTRLSLIKSHSRINKKRLRAKKQLGELVR